MGRDGTGYLAQIDDLTTHSGQIPLSVCSPAVVPGQPDGAVIDGVPTAQARWIQGCAREWPVLGRADEHGWLRRHRVGVGGMVVAACSSVGQADSPIRASRRLRGPPDLG